MFVNVVFMIVGNGAHPHDGGRGLAESADKAV